MSLDVHAIAADRLRLSGRRYTLQRRELVALLSASGSPLSIPQILSGRADLKQSSVYRNLADLEHVGVVRRVATDDEHGRYELAEDLTGHHHHLVCARCGRISDVELPAGVEATLERTLDRLAREAGFASVSHRLDLIGLCASCAGA